MLCDVAFKVFSPGALNDYLKDAGLPGATVRAMSLICVNCWQNHLPEDEKHDDIRLFVGIDYQDRFFRLFLSDANIERGLEAVENGDEMPGTERMGRAVAVIFADVYEDAPQRPEDATGDAPSPVKPQGTIH